MLLTLLLHVDADAGGDDECVIKKFPWKWSQLANGISSNHNCDFILLEDSFVILNINAVNWSNLHQITIKHSVLTKQIVWIYWEKKTFENRFIL